MAQWQGYTELKIGPNVGGLVALSALTYSGSNANVPMPRVQFFEAVAYRKMANGQVKKLGKPIIVWTWPEGMHFEAWNALRDELTDPDMSGIRYIASPDKDGNLQNWQSIMQWDQRPVAYRAFGFKDSLTLRFERCVQQ